jgi:hypothetical protein
MADIDTDLDADLDRDTARALADAGYMPLSEYVEGFGGEEPGRRPQAERAAATAHERRNRREMVRRRIVALRTTLRIEKARRVRLQQQVERLSAEEWFPDEHAA